MHELQDRVKREGGRYLHAKLPEGRSDYCLIARENIFRGWLHGPNYRDLPSLTGILEGVEKGEYLVHDLDGALTTQQYGTWVHKHSLGGFLKRTDEPEEIAAFMQYCADLKERDWHKRPFVGRWGIVGTQELVREVLRFIVASPERTFDFFNTLFQGENTILANPEPVPKYTRRENHTGEIVTAQTSSIPFQLKFDGSCYGGRRKANIKEIPTGRLEYSL